VRASFRSQSILVHMSMLLFGTLLPLGLLLSNFVFCLGLVMVLTKKQVIFILLGIELMLSAAMFNLITWSYRDPMHQGEIFVLFVMAMVVCETAVALAIILKVHDQYKTLTTSQLRHLQERIAQS